LHYIQGLSFNQVSAILGEAVGTVKSRTSRSVKKLREILIKRTQQ
jgi:DNA-directed RNA polymerase specialized sigma24 family protein